MAYKLKRPCSQPGCPNFALPNESYCEVHKKEREHQYNRDRGSATAQGYDSRWQRLRLMFLAEHPVCQKCGRKPSIDVHHIRAKKDGGTDEDANLLALCHECHSEITAKNGGWHRR